MNEKTIQNGLFADLFYRSGQRIICPNYTPRGWWECDLFSITKAGFWMEYEIKISVADFRADAGKERSERDNWREPAVIVKKHDRLAESHPEGPSRFFYVMPAEVAAKVEIPAWAGLVTVTAGRTRIHSRVTKPAPRLHKIKASPEMIGHVQSVFCARYWNLRRGLKEEEQAA
ncbi:MAG: hypothetical protein JWO82_2408 [Akkermansiaceae bacterium]|nr:hypothetical protein [Akkermansiaceae bacterium]